VRNKQFLMNEGPTFITQHPRLCLMMVDIDHFETINDAQGHIMGDHVLHMIGRYLNEYFCNNELVVRFAGKKFTVLMPDCTLDKGKAVAEDFRRKVMKLKPESIDITVSIGLTSSEGMVETTLATLIADADSALHTAQAQGFNRTCLCITHKNITSA
jgi:diguanylate cyclase (GGDEF)-like protein